MTTLPQPTPQNQQKQLDISPLRWLESAGGRYCKVSAWNDPGDSPGKRPIEKDFPNKPYTSEQLLPHLLSGGNAGFLCGKISNNIAILDIDEQYLRFCQTFPPLANVATIVRENAPDKGKILIRINGEMPPAQKWKRSGETSPYLEWLSDGNQGVVFGQHPSCVPYLLKNAVSGIVEMDPGSLSVVCKAWSNLMTNGEGCGLRLEEEPEYTPQTIKPKRTYSNGDGLKERILDRWTPLEVFDHFSMAGEQVQDRQEEFIRLKHNGGLLVNKDGESWVLAGAHGIGGGALEAWWYVKHGNCNVPRGKQFIDLLKEMAKEGNISLLETPPATRSIPPEPEFPPIEGLSDTPPQLRKTRWSTSDLFKADFPEPRWAVPGVIPVGLSFLAGRPKLGKSFLGLQIAIAHATGGKVLNVKVDQGKVLFLALEDSPRRLKKRLSDQRAPMTADITFLTAWKPLPDGGLSELQTEIVNGGYSLVIVDTLSRALGRADQLDPAEMTAICGNLQQLALSQDIAILVIDHHRKNGGFESNPIDDILGSTAKGGVADAAIGLYREQGKHGATLKVTGRDIEEQELSLEWDPVTCCWQCLGDAGQVREDTAKSDILEAIRILAEDGQTPTTTRIAKQLDLNAGYVNHLLADLINAGKVKKGAKIGKEQPYDLLP